MGRDRGPKGGSSKSKREKQAAGSSHIYHDDQWERHCCCETEMESFPFPTVRSRRERDNKPLPPLPPPSISLCIPFECTRDTRLLLLRCRFWLLDTHSHSRRRRRRRMEANFTSFLTWLRLLGQHTALTHFDYSNFCTLWLYWPDPAIGRERERELHR